MNVLVGCETSGMVRDAFIRAGHTIKPCDLLPTDAPGPHYQGDLRDLLYVGGWDLGIFHPECTYLCSSGLHWNNRGRGHERTEQSLDFVRQLLAAPISSIAIENPRGCIGTRIRKASQWVQPYEFGHDASKCTGLWLNNLPLLTPTKRVAGRIVEWPVGSGKLVERWANQTDSGQNNLPPSGDRWKIRSETYAGIADAMAQQWGAK